MRTITNEMIYWTLFTDKKWSFYLAATERGLCYVGSQQKPFNEMKDWTARRFPASELIKNDEQMQRYAKEMEEYMRGERQTFSLPLDFRGTPFQLAVWTALCEIPYGQTWSYSEIAEHIHNPASVRAVGAAIGANPILITVPCHRVIGKNGTLTGYRGGLEMKKQLLQLESYQVTNVKR